MASTRTWSGPRSTVKGNTDPSCDEVASSLEQSEKTVSVAGAVPRIDGPYIDADPVPKPRR
jgi:hypothetical protein